MTKGSFASGLAVALTCASCALPLMESTPLQGPRFLLGTAAVPAGAAPVTGDYCAVFNRSSSTVFVAGLFAVGDNSIETARTFEGGLYRLSRFGSADVYCRGFLGVYYCWTE